MKIFQDILDKKRAMVKNDSSQTESTKDMMDLLLGVKDEDGKQLEDEDIVDLLIVFMLAGHESSAHGALWAVIYMSQNPEVFKKARVGVIYDLWNSTFLYKISIFKELFNMTENALEC